MVSEKSKGGCRGQDRIVIRLTSIYVCILKLQIENKNLC